MKPEDYFKKAVDTYPNEFLEALRKKYPNDEGYYFQGGKMTDRNKSRMVQFATRKANSSGNPDQFIKSF